MKSRSGVNEIRYRSSDNSTQHGMQKEEFGKRCNGFKNPKIYGESDAIMWKYIKDEFLVRIGRKLKRVIVARYEVFDYRDHSELVQSSLNFRERILGYREIKTQQRSNIVGTHSLSLTLRECFTHKNYYVL